MIIVCDKYNENTKKLQQTMQCMNFDAKIVVLRDDGFLPSGVFSPYNHYVYRQNKVVLREKELFYDFLEVPEFWEIRTNGIFGAIYDMGCKKADIFFKEPIEKRNVQRIEWCMENGWKYKIDYYNKYAQKYASEFLSATGKVESKVYYSAMNQEVIVEQPQNDTVTIYEEGRTKAFFTSYVEFIEYYIEEIGFGEKCILFIEDEVGHRLWDLSLDRKNMWKCTLLSNKYLLDKYNGMGGEKGYCFYPLSEEYPMNNAKPEALILTASDQLEGIEYLISELPEVMFHIAANTQVSDKLHKLGKRMNVKVYPQISSHDLNILWDKCDFYLDVNYYREIWNAVDSAQQKNLLIMGFEDTLHDRELTLEECIFRKNDHVSLVSAIKKLINNFEEVQELLMQQHCKKRKKLQELLEMVEE